MVDLSYKRRRRSLRLTEAFVGGAVSSGVQSLAYGGNPEQIGIHALFGGISSFGLYHATSYLSYKLEGGNKFGDIEVSHRQYLRMQADFQRSRFYHKEYGGYLNSDGSYERFSGSGKFSLQN